MERDGDAISTATPKFSTTPDSDKEMPTRRYVGRHLELKIISGLVAEILSCLCWSMSGGVGSVIFKSGVIENVGVAIGMALQSLSVPGSGSTSNFSKTLTFF